METHESSLTAWKRRCNDLLRHEKQLGNPLFVAASSRPGRRDFLFCDEYLGRWPAPSPRLFQGQTLPISGKNRLRGAQPARAWRFEESPREHELVERARGAYFSRRSYIH